MAEPENATKAPESDIAERSAIPSDTVVDQGASLGLQEKHPLASVNQFTLLYGAKTDVIQEISKFGNTEVYVTKPADYPHSPSKLLLLLTGGTGIHSVNNQIQADKYAQEGFLVVMPDQFSGDPAPNSTDPTYVEQTNPSLIERVKLGVTETAKSFLIDMWLARHTPEKVLPILQDVLEKCKEEFADAVANGGGVYAVGYCFGAKYVLLLGSELKDTVAWGEKPRDEEKGVKTKEPGIKVGALAHGTMITKEDIEGVKVPISMACVENDQLFPDEVREEGKKVLEAGTVDHEIQVYGGVPHGFAVFGDYADEKIVAKQKDAFSQMLEWLKSR
ncbi:MAG: hypothetical protein M1820_002629 [Bogoriella megaspora]|nr:MAG: hypothetical protein M1820_002629 [Bogoriella megaspora]